MKNIITAVSISFLLCSSCASDNVYEDLNRDPKNPTQVSEDFLISAATISLSDQMASTNVNNNIYRLISQYITPTTYTDEANYNLTERNIPQTQWSELYRDVLLDLKNAKANTLDNTSLDTASRNLKLAQIEILEIYTWQILVDTFGDIPYSDSLNKEVFLPTYDDDEIIYMDLASRLAETLSNFNTSGTINSDPIYDGDASKLKKF